MQEHRTMRHKEVRELTRSKGAAAMRKGKGEKIQRTKLRPAEGGVSAKLRMI